MEEMLKCAKLFKEDLFKQLARIGKCLSSDKRLEILNILSQSPRTVEKLALCTDMNLANVSRHLQVLLDAKLVKFTKKGTYVTYSLADPEIIEFLNTLWNVSRKQIPDIERIKNDFLNNLDNIKTLSMDEVMSKLNEDSILLVDLRPKEEFEAGHIKGAISIPMEDLEVLMGELPNDAEVVAYCRGPLCVYSALATQKLQSEGFKAYRMEEGLNEWQEHFHIH